MDIFAGAELRSWDRERWQDTAVYDHIRGEWIEPRRTAYGGSRRDLMLSSGSYLAAIYLVSDLVLQILFTVLMAFSVFYSFGIRKITEEMIDGKYSTLNSYVRARLSPQEF